MTRVALLSSEPIRPLMAGIGIRYLEFARRLPAYGIEVALVSPGAPEETAGLGLEGVEIRRFERGRLAAVLGDCHAAVAQGQLANDLVLEMPSLPVAIDLYDPWLIENFAYHETLGLDPYRNDHATWVLQMSRGDFFLCSSEEQRTFYLGFLAAVGRVNPERIAGDPDLATLIAPVPFGVPDELPPHRPVLSPRAAGERRLLFGGLYDWYDPWTLLDALASLDRPWTLLLIRNPNPESTPQRLFAAVEARCRALGWWGSRVQVQDWVPAERRYDLLRDVDLLVAPHRPSLETRLSLRTRFLDALAAGCPVVTSEGGAMSRLLTEHRAGWIAPPGDAPALARTLAEALDDPAARRDGARELVAAFHWDRVLAPLVRFCREPWVDATKDRFGQRPATVAPPDRLAFRLRRKLRVWRGRFWQGRPA
ncbi:MAG: glycosyltransferase family 4 protein [Thermoanaerobaculia bacterium]